MSSYAVYIAIIIVFVVAFLWSFVSSPDAFFAVIDPIVEVFENIGKALVESWRIYIRGFEMLGSFFANITHIRIHYIKPASATPSLPWWGDERRSLWLERKAGLAFDDHGLLLPGYHYEKHVPINVEVAPGLISEHLLRVLCDEGDGILRLPGGKVFTAPISIAEAKPYLVTSTPIAQIRQGEALRLVTPDRVARLDGHR